MRKLKKYLSGAFLALAIIAAVCPIQNIKALNTAHVVVVEDYRKVGSYDPFLWSTTYDDIYFKTSYSRYLERSYTFRPDGWLSNEYIIRYEYGYNTW